MEIMCAGQDKKSCVESFTWSYPLHGVLANRHMITSSQCPLCTADCESIKHALFLCPRVQEVWRILGLGHMVIEVCAAAVCEGGSALADLFLSRSSLQPSMPGVQRNELVATTVWYVWWERRRYVHEDLL